MVKQASKRDCIVYSIQNCAYCAATKRYLEKFNIAFEEIVVDALPEPESTQIASYIKELTGALVFPVIVAGETFTCGFKKKDLQNLLGFKDPRPSFL